MNDYTVKIHIGDHIGKSHVYINGQEIPVTSVKIELNADWLTPRIELGILPKGLIEGEIEVKATPETREVLEALIIEGNKIYKK